MFYSAFADSPITSTTFYGAYQNEVIVQEALKAKSKLTDNLLAYLVDSTKPLDIKLAVINAIGWEHRGVVNSKAFFNYVMDKKQYQSKYGSDFMSFKWQATKDELVCYAYLKALDNYFTIDDAFAMAGEALRKYPKDFSVNMIYNLIKVQALTSVEEYCYASKLFLSLRDNPTLKLDMRNEAMRDIFTYMEDIGKNCKTN
jgi:hypothetical protein